MKLHTTMENPFGFGNQTSSEWSKSYLPGSLKMRISGFSSTLRTFPQNLAGMKNHTLQWPLVLGRISYRSHRSIQSQPSIQSPPLYG